MEKRIETTVNLIIFLSLLATAWDLSLVHHLPGKSGSTAPAAAPLVSPQPVPPASHRG